MMYYQKTVKETLKLLNSSMNGLTRQEITKRQYKFGENILPQDNSISKLKLFFGQFKSFIIYILIVAALISFLLKEWTDGFIITFILILNAIFGYVQEYKAERAIAALKSMQKPLATVLRDGKIKEVLATSLVPGDIIILQEGNFVPADARIIESFALEIDESSLTGESTSVHKTDQIINSECIISNQNNMLFSGTTVTLGHAKAIVISTGINTELGKIATQLKEAKTKQTPLQIKLNKLGKNITYTILIICLITFGIGLIRGFEISELFLSIIALAVAAIPEGLPAVITISLALGAQKLVKQKALIRKLPSVETLGSTTVICSDKTGTLTKNEMTVTHIYSNNQLIEVTGVGYEFKGDFIYENKRINPKDFYKIFEVASICNNATLENSSNPTEKAILIAAKKANLIYNYKRISEVPFTPDNKFMKTINEVKGKNILYMKGAPEIILSRCKYIINKNQIRLMDSKQKSNILFQYENMAKKTLRVLGFAYSKSDKESDLVFVGLMAMIDPPREEVKNSIEECKTAGIRVIMITGDHALTAQAIGRLIGINGKVITGEELEHLSDKQLIQSLEQVSIFARVTPIHKVRILTLLQDQGEIVAMTGDGINDAPALKYADIGTAVGSGSDVAKEASDMILLDNNFSTIVNAIKEGRGIFNNLKKFIIYLFSSNLGELLVLFIGILFGLPLPLLAIHILWINLITDGLPALALTEDPISESVMKSKPRNPKNNIIEKKELFNLIIPGILACIGTLSLFVWYINKGDLIYAQSIAFTTLVMFQMFNVFNCRNVPLKETLNNKFLVGSVLISFILQILVIYGLNGLFKTVPLTLLDWGLIILVSSSVFIIMQLKKVLFKEPILSE